MRWTWKSLFTAGGGEVYLLNYCSHAQVKTPWKPRAPVLWHCRLGRGRLWFWGWWLVTGTRQGLSGSSHETWTMPTMPQVLRALCPFGDYIVHIPHRWAGFVACAGIRTNKNGQPKASSFSDSFEWWEAWYLDGASQAIKTHIAFTRTRASCGHVAIQETCRPTKSLAVS